MPAQHFFVEGVYLGSAIRSSVNLVGTSTAVHGYAFFCPVCCDIWARCPIDGAKAISIRAECGRPGHGRPNRHWIPGSLWLGWDSEFVEALPEAALRREIEVMCDNLERIENGNN